MKTFKVYKLGVVPYRGALQLQLKLLEKRREGEIGDTLLLLEHPPTFTTGRGGDMKNLLAAESYLNKAGIHFEVISRGGDITFHGPGQLVGYPILGLDDMGRDIHKYLRDLEEVIILTLSRYGIESRRVEGVTGVWAKWQKIASIGVGVKRWITYHGFALNVNTDLSYFDMIVPCGIQDVKMTSIQRWLASKQEIDMTDVEEHLIKAFSHVFGLTLTKTINILDESSNDEHDFDILLSSGTNIETDRNAP